MEFLLVPLKAIRDVWGLLESHAIQGVSFASIIVGCFLAVFLVRYLRRVLK